MKKILLYSLPILFLLFFSANFGHLERFMGQHDSPFGNITLIKVYKEKRLLEVYNHGKLLKTYRVALGGNPRGHKQFEGDMKTPEGKYAIDSKNKNSSYYKNLGISYPNDKDQEFAAKAGKSPGGLIKIHGLPNSFPDLGHLHYLRDWTHGCIAVTNEEIDELFNAVEIGTPIEIMP